MSLCFKNIMFCFLTLPAVQCCCHMTKYIDSLSRSMHIYTDTQRLTVRFQHDMLYCYYIIRDKVIYFKMIFFRRTEKSECSDIIEFSFVNQV